MFPQESSKMCQNIHSGCFWDFSLPTALWKFSLITWRRNAFQPMVWSFPSIFTHSLKCRWSSEGTEKSGKGLLFLGRLEWWLIIDETLEQGNESTISIVAARSGAGAGRVRGFPVLGFPPPVCQLLAPAAPPSSIPSCIQPVSCKRTVRCRQDKLTISGFVFFGLRFGAGILAR